MVCSKTQGDNYPLRNETLYSTLRELMVLSSQAEKGTGGDAAPSGAAQVPRGLVLE